MSTALSKSPPKSVSVLVPKIKSLIKAGDVAGERYYREAGVHIIQVQEEWGLPREAIVEWAMETFDRSETQVYIYIRLGEGRSRAHSTSLRAAMGWSKTNDWVAPAIKETRKIVNRINVRAMAQERQNREKEEKLQRQLAHQLIDIGYKVLATKLHPDKSGGSTEGFQRLKEVRDRLKEVYS